MNMGKNCEVRNMFKQIRLGMASVFPLIGVLIITFVTFYTSLHFDFIRWDDTTHLINLIHSQSLSFDSLKVLFTSTINKTYIPLTSLSFAIEYKFFGLNPFVYHLTNLVLHLGVTVCIFLFAQKIGLSGRASAIAALIFGIHPMHVESVVWITERKDVLYSFFYMLTILSYYTYLTNKKVFPYMASVLFCLLSILSKPMALSLPFILFICDWLAKRSVDKSIVFDKILYVLIIVPISWVTYSANMRVPGKSIMEGICIWVWTFGFYIRKFLSPDVLLPLYKLPEPISFFSPPYFLSIFAFVVFMVILIRLFDNRWVKLAFLFYFFSVFFLLRYDRSVDINIVADRFMYLPSAGFCFLLGVLIDKYLSPADPGLTSKKIIRRVCFVLYTFILCAMCFLQQQIWSNSTVFWNNIIHYYPESVIARVNIASEFISLKQYSSAKNNLIQALKLTPNNAYVLNNLGIVYCQEGLWGKGLQYFDNALASEAAFTDAYYNKGFALLTLHHYGQAKEMFLKVLHLDEKYYKAYFQMGNIYFDKGDYQKAIDYYSQAIDIWPDYHDAHYNRELAKDG